MEGVRGNFPVSKPESRIEFLSRMLNYYIFIRKLNDSERHRLWKSNNINVPIRIAQVSQ